MVKNGTHIVGSIVRALAITIAGSFVIAGAQSVPVATTGAQSPLLTVNFHDADIPMIAAAIQHATKTTIKVDPRVHAIVTISYAKPMTVAEFYVAFEEILHEHHFVAVPDGGVIRVIPASAM